MVRGKVEMKRIESKTSRQVTFSKRRSGLLKKAHELSVLCDAEVAVIIFSQNGRLFEFCNNDIQKTIDRYRKYIREGQPDHLICAQQYLQNLKYESEKLAKEVDALEVSKRRFLGQGLNSSSYQELQEIAKQLNRSLINIRARKAQLFTKQTEQLKAKEKNLLEESARLRKKYEEDPNLQPNVNHKMIESIYSNSNQRSMSPEIVTNSPRRVPEIKFL